MDESTSGRADETSRRGKAARPGAGLPSILRFFDASMLATILCCLVAGLLAGCERQAAPPTMEAVRSEGAPDQESWDVRLAVSEDGVPRAYLEAPYLARYERRDSTFSLLQSPPDSLAGRVTAQLFDEAGDASATVRADRLFYYDRERRFEAQGNVVVITPEGKRLESEHLAWREDERRVRTPGFVRITTPTERIQGYDLVADEDLDNYRIARVTGEVTVEEE